MSSYVLMLQADPDDRYLTESTLAEIDRSFPIKYLEDTGKMAEYIAGMGEPAVILLNDRGTITERGQVLRQIKSHTSYRHIPVVVLGERSSPDYVKECYRAGASTFITKPSSVNATGKRSKCFFLIGLKWRKFDIISAPVIVISTLIDKQDALTHYNKQVFRW